MSAPRSPRPVVVIRAMLAVAVVCLAGSSRALAQVSAEQSAKLLKPAEGLEATLWASEPMVINPTNMDIDSRGRVWVSEGLNYRYTHGAGSRFPRAVDADRIKILEDTDGDGKADKVTVFADKISPIPMGLAVEEKWSKDGKYLGARVYVGNSPDLLVFEDTDGDDKADTRTALLTGFGGVDSDHGVHGMVLGLDGKLYFTHGDGCCSFQQDHSHRDQNFNVLDRSGRRVSSNQLANTLRVNRDGTQFEILADRQRNNYETCLNAFGNIFTSDNDDDGNRGSRVIHVFEGGHYGYRTPGSARHWGEDTPGPIPKLVGTGNGSPCGVMLYEGSLLPAEYFGAVLEAEAGPRVINYFPLERHGATFRTDHKIMLASDDNWFRPVDVTAAPDGAVFVADWYDGGVGGHNFRDQTTGRIYRVAPKGRKPETVKIDFGSVNGLVAALRSPVVATRDAARRGLIERHADETEAVTIALMGLFTLGKPHLQARALWVLQATAGDSAVAVALKARDPQLREQAVRMLGRDVSRNGQVESDKPPAQLHAESHLKELLPLSDDPDPSVRRELILVLRDMPTAQVGDALKTLAKGWDGQDRWYLEALGLALERRESDFLASLFDGSLHGDLDLAETGKNGRIAVPPYFPADRNEAYIKAGTPDLASNGLGKTLGLIWRLHRSEALGLVGKILPSLDAPELKQAADDVLMQFNDKQAALVVADLSLQVSDPARKNGLLDILARKLGGGWKDARSDARVVAAIDAALKAPAQRAAGINVASATGEARYGPALMAFARDEKAAEDVRVAAIEALGRIKPARTAELLDGLILGAKGRDASTSVAEAALRTMPSVRDASATLSAMIAGNDYPLGLRREALRIFGRLPGGGLKLLAMAREKKLPAELTTEATAIVHRDQNRLVRDEASSVLPLPKTASGRPLPPMFMMIRTEGKPEHGQAVFYRSGATACATCHRVQGRGQWIGPDLSTIGSKYGKAELIQSILNPSAAIGYNFRTTIASLNDGRVITGLVVEDAPDRLVLKTAEGERMTIKPGDVESRKQSEVSLMPEGLAQTMETQDFLDLLSFLGTLKQPVSIVGQYHVARLDTGDDDAVVSGKALLSWGRAVADAEGQVALRPIAGEEAGKAAYLSAPVVAPEPLQAKLVIDAKSAVAAFLNGKHVALKTEADGTHTAEVMLSKGENPLILRVPGGSQGGLTTTFVAAKPLEFR